MVWDPTQPATSAALLSAPIRDNFAALDALMVAGGHGTVRLRRSTATTLVLDPYNGNNLIVKAGTWRLRALPAGGLALTNTSCMIDGVAGQAVVANTMYLVAVRDVAGTLTLCLTTSLAHSPDVDTGVEILTTDANYVIVGLIRTDATGTFRDSSSQRLTASWFNRKRKVGTGTFSTGRSTSSLTPVELHSEIRVEFVGWEGDTFEVQWIGSTYNTTGNTVCYTGILVNGSVSGIPGIAMTSAASVQDVSMTAGMLVFAADGYAYVTLTGLVLAGTGTWSQVGNGLLSVGLSQ